MSTLNTYFGVLWTSSLKVRFEHIGRYGIGSASSKKIPTYGTAEFDCDMD